MHQTHPGKLSEQKRVEVGYFGSNGGFKHCSSPMPVCGGVPLHWLYVVTQTQMIANEA